MNNLFIGDLVIPGTDQIWSPEHFIHFDKYNYITVLDIKFSNKNLQFRTYDCPILKYKRYDDE